MVLGKLASNCGRLKPDPCLSPCSNINSNWSKDPNVMPKIWNCYRKELGKHQNTWAYTITYWIKLHKGQNWQMELTKLNFLCTAKEECTTLKKHPTECEKVFGNYASEKGLIIRIYREPKETKLPKNQQPN
jgi:hypothetical protein